MKDIAHQLFHKIKIAPTLIVLWAIVLFDAFDGIHDWRLWIPIGLIGFFMLVLYLFNIFVSKMVMQQRKAIEEITKTMAQGMEEMLRGGGFSGGQRPNGL